MPDFPAATIIQQPNALTNLGQIMGIAKGGLELAKGSATLGAEISRIKAESRKAETEAGVSAGTAQPRIEGTGEEAKQSQIETMRKQLGLSKERMDAIESNSDTMAQDPAVKALSDPNTPDEAISGLVQRARDRLIEHKGFTKALGIPEQMVEAGSKLYEDALTKNPRGYGEFLLQRKVARTSPAEQVGAQTPQYAESGQQLINVKPTATGPQTIQKQLPPTTETVNAEGQKVYIIQGIQGGSLQERAAQAAAISDPRERAAALRQVFANQNTQPAQVPAGPKPGQVEATIGAQDSMKNHFDKEVLPMAASAPQDIGVLKNIKNYAKGAITGVETDRRSYIEGIAGLLGMDKAQIAKTDTDMLIKNSTMLAQQGGHTDAERALAGAMNPNSHMTPEAIQHAADQVIAQRKMAVARQKILLPHRNSNDPVGYQSKLAEFNSVADPRALQSVDEIHAMAKDIKDAGERAAFLKDIAAKKRKLHDLGVTND